MKYSAPPMTLSRHRCGLVMPSWAAVFWVSIIMPRTPVGETARGFQCDSW
jgi:hypothetical protein